MANSQVDRIRRRAGPAEIIPKASSGQQSTKCAEEKRVIGLGHGDAVRGFRLHVNDAEIAEAAFAFGDDGVIYKFTP